MKKIYFLSAAVLVLFAALSCQRESAVPELVRTTIEASIAPATRTALGEKDGTAWPNYWKAGDQICINGIFSDPLGEEFDGESTAYFSFIASLRTPFSCFSPASAVFWDNEDNALFSYPAVQHYVEGSYDPSAFVMYGVSEVAGKAELSPAVSLVHLSLSGSASISRIRLTGDEEAFLSGSALVDNPGTPLTASNEVELVAETPVALPAEFFICVPSGLSGPLTVKVFDSEGGSMFKHATVKSPLASGQAYSPATIPYVGTEAGDFAITAEAVTSSTAVICWEGSAESAYTIGVFSDAGCTSLVDQYVVPAGDDCWGEATPRFCISGLTPGTTYYVTVIDGATHSDSNVLPVTTEAFEIVEVSDTPAAEGDVILAEDFGELRWDCDMIGEGVGWFPTEEARMSSFATVDVASYQAATTSNEKQLSSYADPLNASRLAHWGQGASPNMYVHPGYLKLVGSNKVTHLVTPALENIPEDMVATVEVELTASRYYSASSSSFCTDMAIVAVQPAGEFNELVDETKTNALDLETNVASITLPEETAWHTYKVTLSGVFKGDRLAFGADPSVTKNEARMNISDMKVTIKELGDSYAASVKSVSSSTASFTWTHNRTAAFDVSKPYTIALYRDEACSDLVVSYDIPADDSCWDGKKPCFSFGGLAPSTTYWFVAEDTEEHISTKPVSATTEAFTVVDVTTVSNPAVGDVILAEDFSEIAHGPDELAGAAGFVPSTHNLLPAPAGANPDGGFVGYNNTGNRIFGSGWHIDGSRMDKGWGFFGNSSCYSRNGYLRVSASSGRTHIVTPALSCIPEGMIATIEVTVTAGKYEVNDNDVAVFAEKGLTMNSQTSPSEASYKKYTGASLSDGHGLGTTAVKSWETKSVTIGNIDSEHQLIIGSLENISGKNRFYLSDVKVKITALVDDPVMKIKDDASFNAFVSAVAGGNKTVDARVIQDIDLSAATVEAFATIEDYAGTLDGNGKTISGLTKPMFNDLKGTVKDLTLNSTLNITTDQVDLGILAKVLSGTAVGCTSKGSVTFNVSGGVKEEHRIGGLIGKAAASGATITDCTNEATVTNETASASGNEGELIIGGVLGCFWGTQFAISGCENTGDVTNNADWNKAVSVGGIIGQPGNGSSASSDLKVTDCTNSGAVCNNGDSESSNNVGGIIGWLRFGTYTGNSNTGSVSNTGDAPNNYVGGVIGYVDKNISLDDNSNSGDVSNGGQSTRAAGSMSTVGGNFVGGLFGRLGQNVIFKNNANSGTVYNSGDANNGLYIGGIVGYLDKSNAISDAPSDDSTPAKYKLTNSGDIENAGSAKNICIGGLFGRNSSGYFNMRGSSGMYSSNSGEITDSSGPAKSAGGDISIGGIAGYTSTGIKTQYARNTGKIYVTGDKGGTSVNAGGIGGWISNAAYNFNNCRNAGDITVDCTTTASLWVAGIVGCPKPTNTTKHYYWRSNATIDTHAATVGGENYTAGLIGTTEGDDPSTFIMFGIRLAGTVWGSKTTTGLFCCTKSNECSFTFDGGSSNPNRIAPGTVRKDDVNEDTVNEITDVTIGILAGGAGSTCDISTAISNSHLVVEEW